MLGNPYNATPFLVAGKQLGVKRRWTRREEEEEEGSSPLNVDSPQRRRTTKGDAKGWELRKAGVQRRGGWGGCVKLTAALNPSSWQWLDPIRPARPRTRWQGLSCQRHQWTDGDRAWPVPPPTACVTQQTSSSKEKNERQQVSGIQDNSCQKRITFCCDWSGLFRIPLLFLLVRFSSPWTEECVNWIYVLKVASQIILCQWHQEDLCVKHNEEMWLCVYDGSVSTYKTLLSQAGWITLRLWPPCVWFLQLLFLHSRKHPQSATSSLAAALAPFKTGSKIRKLIFIYSIHRCIWVGAKCKLYPDKRKHAQ